ncbi:hypothetical protein Syun_019074 [Stephania yunnanensis]|uniref:Uncharacterized protein n=1 Tax=Stephania yunnanensis TaxID=152371 RepID=A0AAP0IVE1_9MAGN
MSIVCTKIASIIRLEYGDVYLLTSKTHPKIRSPVPSKSRVLYFTQRDFTKGMKEMHRATLTDLLRKETSGITLIIVLCMILDLIQELSERSDGCGYVFIGANSKRVWSLPCCDLTETSKRDDGIDLLKDNQALQHLTGTAEKAKMDLSSLTQTNISLPFITSTADGPKHIETTITRAKFEELCFDLLDSQVDIGDFLNLSCVKQTSSMISRGGFSAEARSFIYAAFTLNSLGFVCIITGRCLQMENQKCFKAAL